MLDAARKQGLTFLTDQDARPAGGAHPETHLWDSGANAVDELKRFLGVRSAALARFGENNVRSGAPLALLEDVLVPLYLSHRYQMEAAVKSVAGLRYSYALRGDGQTPTQIVAAAEQRRALEAVLVTIQPETLTLPESVIKLIPPRPAGFDRTRELFRHRTGLTFDPVAAAESAADMTVELIVNPQRAARLVEYHARDAGMPGLGEVLERLFTVTWKAPEKPGLAAEVQHAVQYVALRRAMNLAVDEEAPGQVRAVALSEINKLKTWLAAHPGGANVAFGLAEIAAFEKDPKQMRLPKAPEPPPGMPIGMAGLSCDWE
ncbi:MAG: zinc-dependent metalloprotease [Paludibaculum sp.]